MKSFHVYILECSDNSYYVGHTDNLEQRLEQHLLSETNSYVSSRKPFKLVYSAPCGNRDYAKQADASSGSARSGLKGWSRKKK